MVQGHVRGIAQNQSTREQDQTAHSAEGSMPAQDFRGPSELSAAQARSAHAKRKDRALLVLPDHALRTAEYGVTLDRENFCDMKFSVTELRAIRIKISPVSEILHGAATAVCKDIRNSDHPNVALMSCLSRGIPRTPSMSTGSKETT